MLYSIWRTATGRMFAASKWLRFLWFRIESCCGAKVYNALLERIIYRRKENETIFSYCIGGNLLSCRHETVVNLIRMGTSDFLSQKRNNHFLCMESLCHFIGFDAGRTVTFVCGKTLAYVGELYFGEHKRNFTTENIWFSID